MDEQDDQIQRQIQLRHGLLDLRDHALNTVGKAELFHGVAGAREALHGWVAAVQGLLTDAERADLAAEISATRISAQNDLPALEALTGEYKEQLDGMLTGPLA